MLGNALFGVGEKVSNVERSESVGHLHFGAGIRTKSLVPATEDSRRAYIHIGLSTVLSQGD